MSDRESAKRKLIFYEAALNAWLTNRMQLDKSLLWISALDLGALLNFQSKIQCMSLWWSAGIFSLATIFLILFTFYINSIYLEHIIKDKKEKEETYNGVLSCLFTLTLFSFLISILVTCLAYTA